MKAKSLLAVLIAKTQDGKIRWQREKSLGLFRAWVNDWPIHMRDDGTMAIEVKYVDIGFVVNTGELTEERSRLQFAIREQELGRENSLDKLLEYLDKL